MISQTEAAATTLNTATPTTNNHHNLQPQDASNLAHHNDTKAASKVANFKDVVVKKKKRFDETIIDGFAIIAFKTWEDLQDELNDMNSGNTTSANNNNTNNNNNYCETNSNCAAEKKVNSKSKQKQNSSTSSTATASLNTTNSSTGNSISLPSNNDSSFVGPTTTTKNSSVQNDSTGHCKKSKEKVNKSALHSMQVTKEPKEKRNKTSSEKTTLKKALEAKELAEKRLTILEEKLKQEQYKNMTHQSINHNPTVPKQQHLPHHFQPPPPHSVEPLSATLTHIQTPKEDVQNNNSRGNGLLGHDLLKDPTSNNTNQGPKPTPYSPFHTHISSQFQRSNPTAIHPHTMQLHQTSSPPHQQNPPQHQTHQSKHHPHLPQHQLHSQQSNPPQPLTSQAPPPSQHLLHTPAPPQPVPQSSSILHQNPPQPTPPPTLSTHQTLPQYTRQPPLTSTQTHLHLLQHPPQLPQPPLNPFTSSVPNPIMSTMGLSSLASPYSCPQSIYITDTISRQTSIIPQAAALGPGLDPLAPPAGVSRFSHSNVLHPISPYNPLVPSHHPMYYPTQPTERSFIEFARSYAGPGNLGYPSLMNPYPNSAPNLSNPYGFDRWPRAALDHQRAVSRYNSLYQSTTTTTPDRNYANYNSNRPTFPAGLFPPPF